MELYSSFSEKSERSISSIENKLNNASRKIKNSQDIKRQLSSIKISTNKFVPAEFLNEEGEIKSIDAAFRYQFPDIKFEDVDEDIELQCQKQHKYEDYTLSFTDLPEE
ncbi:Hypothetical_protein [Hexamita inflata]|uniref:Hypothetical_protein n=1 Tax=Hexamita inflata TaxID=28002 RepID=A0AA86P527_9EUKA|nr:Hypothetical protein HINF_LOCUS20037 [Hexamita inflata]CAI9953623.1 Hypothetical protein HINF_LOCUS41268 [Hexamita inflata]